MLQNQAIQIDARITTLADKLGLEKQQLWDSIVKQAKVEAWTDIGFAVIGLGMALAGVIVLKHCVKEGNRSKDHYGD